MQEDQADQPGPSPEQAFFLSLLLPGGGQFALGQRRWMAYGVAEVGGLIWILERRSTAHGFQDEYRDLAWTSARSGVGSGPRFDGDFDYYEVLSKWTRSGAHDRDPVSAGVQPETDPATFNGSIWARARALFSIPDGSDDTHPDHAKALDHYEEHAYGSSFLWDWSADSSAQARLGSLIKKSDDTFQNARILTGVVVANHVLSAVDAFVSARLRQASGGRLESATTVLPQRTAQGIVPRWRFTLRLRW